MRTTMQKVLLTAVFVALCCASPARSEVVVCFGDSITEGEYGIPGYPAPLQGMLAGDKVINAGKGSESTFHGAMRFGSVMQTHRPQYALIMEGANDAVAGFTAATTTFFLGQMVNIARQYDAVPILSTVTPNTQTPSAGALVPSYNAAISKMASDQKIPLVDSYGRVVGNWGALTVEGLHPNAVGTRVIAQGFAEGVNGNRKGSGDGGGGGCFIATAAFGSYAEPHVLVLREFRDEILLPRRAGQWFVGQYYKYSPPLADYIADRPALKATVRTSLLPVVGLAWLGLHHPAFLFAGLLAMLALGAVALRRLRRQTP